MANAVNTELWKQYNGKGFAAEYSEYSERANKDADGNIITLTIADSKVSQIGGKSIAADSATSADTATRATQDADGNVITSTYTTKTEMSSALDTKQDTIPNLDDIESGAELGTTSIQPSDLIEEELDEFPLENV